MIIKKEKALNKNTKNYKESLIAKELQQTYQII
jgi:hypothetical protein